MNWFIFVLKCIGTYIAYVFLTVYVGPIAALILLVAFWVVLNWSLRSWMPQDPDAPHFMPMWLRRGGVIALHLVFTMLGALLGALSFGLVGVLLGGWIGWMFPHLFVGSLRAQVARATAVENVLSGHSQGAGFVMPDDTLNPGGSFTPKQKRRRNSPPKAPAAPAAPTTPPAQSRKTSSRKKWKGSKPGPNPGVTPPTFTGPIRPPR